MRLIDVARVLGTSSSHVSRAENGLIKGIGVPALARHAAVVGLKPYFKLYPAIGRPLDAPQLALLGRFRKRIHPSWQVQLEVPIPRVGDLRAADAMLTIGGCRCMVEVITRIADFQAQLRSAHLKQRDLNADRLILVVSATTTNRRVLRAAGAAVPAALPLGTKPILRSLLAGADPGADGLVLL